MPFSDGARITIENRGERTLGGLIGGALVPRRLRGLRRRRCPTDVLRFHAAFRQERRTAPVGDQPNVQLHEGINLNGAENYVALDTDRGGADGRARRSDRQPQRRLVRRGRRHGVRRRRAPGRRPSTAPAPRRSSAAAPARRPSTRRSYSGFHLIESPRYDGLVGMYRWYVRDPIHFAHVAALDDRARPRQQLRQRLRVGRVLVPGAAGRAAQRCRRRTSCCRRSPGPTRKRSSGVFGMVRRYMGDRADPELAIASFWAACDAGSAPLRAGTSRQRSTRSSATSPGK